MRITTLPLTLLLALPLLGQDLLLEDYQGGGVYSPADWANTFADPNGKQNQRTFDGGFATVGWGMKWSGVPSTGDIQDASNYKTLQVDVRVEKGQPVEEESNFYFQLLNDTNVGYAYWEAYVPQTKLPADGQWYRIQLPISKMIAQCGDGAEKPKGFTEIRGCCCGMTFDATGDRFKYKLAMFDNVKLLTAPVKDLMIQQR